MKKNFLSGIKDWFTYAFAAAEKAEKKPSLAEMHALTTAAKVVKNVGRGAYFHNNRRRTRGRNIQYVAMSNGTTKVIRHETI